MKRASALALAVVGMVAATVALRTTGLGRNFHTIQLDEGQEEGCESVTLCNDYGCGGPESTQAYLFLQGQLLVEPYKQTVAHIPSMCTSNTEASIWTVVHDSSGTEIARGQGSGHQGKQGGMAQPKYGGMPGG